MLKTLSYKQDQNMIGDAMGFNPIRKFTAMQMTEWSDEKFNNYFGYLKANLDKETIIKVLKLRASIRSKEMRRGFCHWPERVNLRRAR